MRQALAGVVATPLYLEAETAGDLMERNPVSIRDEATVREAITLLTGKGFKAVPVINEAGQPIGVVSRGDILVHEREQSPGSEAARLDPALVRDIMTPAVFSVTPETAAVKVIEEMTAMGVHQLFVMDHDGILVGLISVFDILRHLHSPETTAHPEQ